MRFLVAIIIFGIITRILNYLFPDNIILPNIESSIAMTIILGIFYWLGITAKRTSSQTKQRGNWYWFRM